MGNLKIRRNGIWISPCEDVIKLRAGINWKQIIDGTKVYINGLWQNINCQSVALPDFDYLKITYSWEAATAGNDLDTFTGLIDTLTAFDNSWVGYGQNQGNPKIPTGSATPYVWWAGDNTSGGKETVLINFKQFLIDNPSVPNPIKIRMNAVWYSEKRTGYAAVGITTYKGGTMSIDAPTFDFINTGGVVVSDVSFNTSVALQSNSGLIANSQNVAIVNYNQTDYTAVLNLV